MNENLNNISIVARKFTSDMINNNLFQICNLQNIINNVLDLVYTNMPELAIVEKADLLLIPESIADKAHVQMVCTIECAPKVFQLNSEAASVYCFKKADYDAINDCINNIDFEQLFADSDINSMVDKFYATLYEIYDEFVPKSTIRVSNKPVWYDKKLTNLKNIRNRYYKKLCKKRLKDINADQSSFIEARNNFDSYNKQKYEEFVTNIIKNNNENPKKFWRFINGKRKSNTLPCKLEFNGSVATNDTDKASLFAEFFSSVYAAHGRDDSLPDFIKNRNDQNTFRIIPSVASIVLGPIWCPQYF